MIEPGQKYACIHICYGFVLFKSIQGYFLSSLTIDEQLTLLEVYVLLTEAGMTAIVFILLSIFAFIQFPELMSDVIFC